MVPSAFRRKRAAAVLFLAALACAQIALANSSNGHSKSELPSVENLSLEELDNQLQV